MANLNTCRIEDGEGGYLIINEIDFNPRKHRKITATPVMDDFSAPEVPPEPEPSSKPESRQQRTEYLTQLYLDQGWSAIKPIAENLGISKPSTGWDDAIPLIVDAEFGGDHE